MVFGFAYRNAKKLGGFVSGKVGLVSMLIGSKMVNDGLADSDIISQGATGLVGKVKECYDSVGDNSIGFSPDFLFWTALGITAYKGLEWTGNFFKADIKTKQLKEMKRLLEQNISIDKKGKTDSLTKRVLRTGGLSLLKIAPLLGFSAALYYSWDGFTRGYEALANTDFIKQIGQAYDSLGPTGSWIAKRATGFGLLGLYGVGTYIDTVIKHGPSFKTVHVDYYHPFTKWFRGGNFGRMVARWKSSLVTKSLETADLRREVIAGITINNKGLFIDKRNNTNDLILTAFKDRYKKRKPVNRLEVEAVINYLTSDIDNTDIDGTNLRNNKPYLAKENLLPYLEEKKINKIPGVKKDKLESIIKGLNSVDIIPNDGNILDIGVGSENQYNTDYLVNYVNHQNYENQRFEVFLEEKRGKSKKVIPRMELEENVEETYKNSQRLLGDNWAETGKSYPVFNFSVMNKDGEDEDEDDDGGDSNTGRVKNTITKVKASAARLAQGNVGDMYEIYYRGHTYLLIKGLIKSLGRIQRTYYIEDNNFDNVGKVREKFVQKLYLDKDTFLDVYSEGLAKDQASMEVIALFSQYLPKSDKYEKMICERFKAKQVLDNMKEAA